MNGEEPVVLLHDEGEFDEEATVLLAEEAEIAVPPEVKDSEQWIGDAMETIAGGEADCVGKPLRPMTRRSRSLPLSLLDRPWTTSSSCINSMTLTAWTLRPPG